ncbi:MAG: hypothetical protein J6Y04_00225 [Bacteroidaceae bacterium]|nr:hypothetical protein [Bacteroidaceae bacterium]
MKMIYIEPYMKVVEMAMDVNIMAESDIYDYADAKEFKDDDLWNEEVTSEGAQKSNLWDKEW